MDLNAVRERINAIDDQIVDLFVERMKASADVASAKAEKNLPVLDLRREQAVLEKVMERGGEEFEIYINKLYQTIFDSATSRVYSMRWNPVCADMACCPSKTAPQAL